MVLIFISLMKSDAEHLFMCLFGHLDVFSREMSIHVFCPVFNWIIGFIGVELYKFLVIWVLTLYWICHSQISVHILYIAFEFC